MKLAAIAVAAGMLFGTFIFEPKFWGVILMGLSIVALFLLPWLDQSAVRSIRYRGWMSTLALTLFVVSFIVLGYMGMKHPDHTDLFLFKNVRWAQIGTLIYALFFILMPLYSAWDETKPEPERVSFK